jgi:hypothetical protein
MKLYFENTTTLSSFIARDISSIMRRLTIRRFTTSEIALADTPSFLAKARMDTPSLMSAILISNGVILFSFSKIWSDETDAITKKLLVNQKIMLWRKFCSTLKFHLITAI